MTRGGKELIRGLCSYGQLGWPRVRSPLNLHIGIILLGCAHCPRLVPLSQTVRPAKHLVAKGWGAWKSLFAEHGYSGSMLRWGGIWAKHLGGVCQCPPCPSPSFSLGSFPKSTEDWHPPHLFLVFPTWNPHTAFLSMACLATKSFSIVKTGYIDSNDSSLEGYLSCQLDGAVLQTGCLPSMPDPCPGDTRTSEDKQVVTLDSDPGAPEKVAGEPWLLQTRLG